MMYVDLLGYGIDPGGSRVSERVLGREWPVIRVARVGMAVLVSYK
jgi:hypothetical protein